VLPLILQHVRELVELQLAGTESSRYKILTPFPPTSPDFADFDDSALTFSDPPEAGDSASRDTVRAFEFFNRTDYLYYDYSYGIRSEDYRLSSLCRRFFSNAVPTAADVEFDVSFTEKKDAFERRYLRSTVGDLGNYDFRYTSPSAVSWYSDRVVLPAAEVQRMKDKTIAVYKDLDVGNSGLVTALVESIRSMNYPSVSYDLGSFDVIREWMDARLFENPNWSFPSGSRQLYGEGDPVFASDAAPLKLCFAQRFYLVRDCSGEPEPTEQPTGGVVVRDHRDDIDPRRLTRDRLMARSLARFDAAATAVMATAMGPATVTPVAIASAADATPAEAKPGFVWVPATATVPGHWERERAHQDPPPGPSPPVYRVGALMCRLVSPRPGEVVGAGAEERAEVPT
jgi:hypothetical protein